MTTYFYNKTASRFPVQSGKPVLITEEQFQACCCDKQWKTLWQWDCVAGDWIEIESECVVREQDDYHVGELSKSLYGLCQKYSWGAGAPDCPAENDAPGPDPLTEEELEYCCSFCCDEEHSEYPGEINLLTRFPSVDAGEGFVPYPDGVICLGPFDVDVIIRHETDVQCYYDDQFLYGIEDVACAYPTGGGWGAWYGPLDGVPQITILANPLPAGSVFVFTVVSDQPTKVGIVINPPGQPGSYAKITWATS